MNWLMKVVVALKEPAECQGMEPSMEGQIVNGEFSGSAAPFPLIFSGEDLCFLFCPSSLCGDALGYLLLLLQRQF